MVGHSGSIWHFFSASSGHEITSPIPLWRLSGSNEIGFARDSEWADREDDIAQCRGWKLFLLLPRLLLFRPPRGGLIPKQQLQNRFSLFSRGEWEQLLLQSEECVAVASKAFQRKRRTQIDTPERRADRAESLVTIGFCRPSRVGGSASCTRHTAHMRPIA